MRSTTMSLLIMFVFYIVLAVIGPILTIWALNTLFPILDIPYTLQTWVAVLLLGGLFNTKVIKK